MSWNNLIIEQSPTLHEQMLIIAIIGLSGLLDEDPKITYSRLKKEAGIDFMLGGLHYHGGK